MTRMHFEAIAETLAQLRPDRGNKYAPRLVRTNGAAAFEQWKSTVTAVSATLGRFNAGFNADRFFRACGLEVEDL